VIGTTQKEKTLRFQKVGKLKENKGGYRKRVEASRCNQTVMGQENEKEGKNEEGKKLSGLSPRGGVWC